MPQHLGQHLVVEDASNLLIEKLERGRLVTYVEQPAHHIQYDQKDAAGHYRFYVPAELRGKLRSQYIRTMNQLFDTYAKLVTDLTAHVRATSSVPPKERNSAWRTATEAQAYHAALPLLPVAATATIGMYAHSQAIESTVVRLLSDELPEVRSAGQQILDIARKDTPALLENADKPELGGAITAYRANTNASVEQLAQALLPPNHTAESSPVTLVSYLPRNELDIVADILYKHSDLPLAQLQNAVANWPYQRKAEVVTAYIGERLRHDAIPGRALEKIRYSFDLVCSYRVFRDLQRHRVLDALERQPLSPRLGYDIPELVEQAGAIDTFEQCFDLSLQLYSALQAGNFTLQAQYATLLGHNVRWQVTYSAREAFRLHELHAGPKSSPDHRGLVLQMHTAIGEVHPMLAEAMRFVGQGESPELVKQATERYAQYKLAKLDSAKAAE